MPNIKEKHPIIVVRPPAYFPTLEYTALMQAADIVVLADTFQYSRQSFQNRTRIRNAQSWQWVSVPLKGGQHGLPILETRIRQVPGWKKRHWKAIAFNYSRTPFFAHYADPLHATLKHGWTKLSALTCETMRQTHEWFGFTCDLVRASELPDVPNSVEDVLAQYPQCRLLAPQGTPEATNSMWLHYQCPSYRQAFGGFVPDLMALDLLFNYGPESATLLRSGTRFRAAAIDSATIAG